MTSSGLLADARVRIALLAACIVLLVVSSRNLPAFYTEEVVDDQQCKSSHATTASVASRPKASMPKWQDTNLADIPLKESAVTCSAAYKDHMTCMFENMVLYRGDLWYIAADEDAAESVEIPDPLLFEVGNSPSNNFEIPKIISALAVDDALETISKTAPRNSPIKVVEFDAAIFQRTRTFNNWFWALNGAGNIFHRLCKYFEACTSVEIKKAAVLQPIIDSSRNLSEVGYVGLPNHHAQAAKDLMDCFGPLFWVNHPAGREIDERPNDQVIILKKVIVGIGDDVVQPKAALDKESNVRYRQAEPEISLKRIKFIRQCAGLSPEPSPRTRPSVLLVNRPYGDGRTILGLDDVADRLRRALPDEVPVRLFFPRGTAGISDQALAFDAATVVVAPHGAATANFNFLPHDAVALGVFALSGRWGHDEAVGESMPAPPYNISVWKVDCTESTEARALAAGELPEFQALDPKDQVALLLGKEMDGARVKQVKSLLGMSLLDWMDYRSYLPDLDELTQAVLDAVKEWEVKVEARKKSSAGKKGRR